MGEENEKQKKGFSGLSSLATDSEKVDDHIEAADRDVSDYSSSPKSSPEEREISTAAPPSGSSISPILWFLGIIGVLILIGVFSNQGEKSRNSGQRPRTTNLPAPTPTQISPVPTTVPKTQKSEITFEKPPAGTNLVLSVSQIRWCLREEIRLETMRDLLITNEAISEFNRLIEEYNSRAGSYRYAPGALEQARMDVEGLRTSIVKKATTDAAVLGKSSTPKPKKTIDNIPKERQPTESHDSRRTEADAEDFEAPQQTDNTSTSGNSNYTRGSHQDDVLRLQGTPTQIIEYYDHETWYYGYSCTILAIC